MLALTGAIESWLAAIVLGRDVMILATAGVLYLTTKRRNFPPSRWGKASTLVQILFLCFQIGLLAGIAVAPAVVALKWITVALAIASLAAEACGEIALDGVSGVHLSLRDARSSPHPPGVHILFPVPAISSISSLSLFTNAPGSSS